MSTTQGQPRVCERDACGMTFTPKRSDARYCSDACRNAANRARSRSDPIRSANRADPANHPARGVLALTWDPPSEPRGPYQTAEPCPGCHAALIAEPRGIWRVCAPCGGLVTPPGVTAPYAAGTAPQRQVKSQRERDAEARALEARRQRLADELDGLAADKRLTSETCGTLKWYRAEVDQAKTMNRLDDLIDQFRDERLTRTGWLARPAVAEIEPADYDDDQADDWDDEDQGDEPLAIGPAPARATDYAGAMSVLGWRMTREPVDGCQVGGCGSPWAEHIATTSWAGGLVCRRHLAALDQVITRDHDRSSRA